MMFFFFFLKKFLKKKKKKKTPHFPLLKGFFFIFFFKSFLKNFKIKNGNPHFFSFFTGAIKSSKTGKKYTNLLRGFFWSGT